MKRILVAFCFLVIASLAALAPFYRQFLWALLIVGPVAALMAYDLLQRRHTILRNFPVVGHVRYLLEDFRHHVRQYLIQGDDEGHPFIREQRAIVYSRAKGEIDSHAFGSIRRHDAVGHEFLEHSLIPLEPPGEEKRLRIGGPACSRPYAASRLNISAMSYGSLGAHAVAALNLGARLGGFAQNTGEGGISDHHTRYGGDLIWQIGTAFFGCRDADGAFDPERFRDQAALEPVRMIELKLSQGAKPGGGGLLPGRKVTPEIARIRGVPVGETVHSPPAFATFDTPRGLLHFVQQLRELSAGKPVGIKLCIGSPRQFFALVKAMLETGIRPDFVTVDGSEGGTGAAPQELSDFVGTPLREGIILAHNALVGAGLREDLRLLASGKIVDGFDLTAKLAMGADACNAARAFMFALGCIQARACNRNVCPTGITTMDPWRQHGLVVGDKAPRVARYHRATIASHLQVMAACGVAHPEALDPARLMRRIAPDEIRSYRDLFDYLEPGALLENPAATRYGGAWAAARADSFA